MSLRIKEIILLCCAACVVLLTIAFYSRPEKLQADAPLVTQQMVKEYQDKVREATEKRQNAEAARQRAELETRMVQCQSNEECIIVDKDPCGCLTGPEGVTAINSEYSLEFSGLVEKDFSEAKTCPSIGSVERECSASARAVCQEQRCTIIY